MVGLNSEIDNQQYTGFVKNIKYFYTGDKIKKKFYETNSYVKLTFRTFGVHCIFLSGRANKDVMEIFCLFHVPV